MASSPLVQAVEHFSLAQLMADPNLCRNVLNDVGALPAETFLLIAALEARVPQTLIEHIATNDLSVVEPRLVAELAERGVERGRAAWAVEAWKEVVGGTSLGQQTMRPAEPLSNSSESSGPAETVRPSQPSQPPVTVRPSQPSQPVTVRPSQPAPDPHSAAVAPRPVAQASTAPMARSGGGRRRSIVAAAVVVVLLVAGAVAWLARPSSTHHSAGAASSASSHPSTSAASSPSTSAPVSSGSTANSPAANLNAPLGAASIITVPGTAAWTDTHLKVTKGERINITATGLVAHAIGATPGGPNGVVGGFSDFSIIGGQHAALIGLVGGSGAPFFVGSSYNDVAGSSGELYLGINDVGTYDNSGKFTVTLRLQQS